VKNNLSAMAKEIKEGISSFTPEASLAHFEAQREHYEKEYAEFLLHYERNECYLCGKPFPTIGTSNPCLHWLLRRCKFKKKEFTKLYDKYDFYSISAYLRWVAYAAAGSKNINNLKEEKSERKLFETTIKWKNIEWTLDCSHNDFSGHPGTNSDFPHWHFQMRIDGKPFINFNDFHIPFSKNDQLKIMLENDPESGFVHSFGPGGLGMQEQMDQLLSNTDEFLARTASASDPENGEIHLQSIVKGPEGGIPGEKIDEAVEMAKATGKTFAYCLREVLKDIDGVSITTIASPADSVPEIAKRSERKRR
jgi:hypothetical protein